MDNKAIMCFVDKNTDSRFGTPNSNKSSNAQGKVFDIDEFLFNMMKLICKWPNENCNSHIFLIGWLKSL